MKGISQQWWWVAALGVVLVAPESNAVEPLRLVASIPLLGVEGRMDHMAVDEVGQRLFIAALGNNSLEVVNLADRKVQRSVGDLHEPQGVSFLKDHGITAVANGEGGTCQLFNAKSLERLEGFDLHSDADNLRYDAKGQRLYVGFGDGALGVIDIKQRKRLDDIPLPSHPESFQLEARGNRIFVNVPKSRQISVVDRSQAKVIATWPVDKAASNFPMALDEVGHRLFVGCRTPATVLVYDTESGKVVSQFPTVGDTDDLFYDAKTARLYVAGGEGLLVVHQERGADGFTQLAKIPTAAGARTALFSPNSGQLYLAVPHRNSQAAELRIYEVVPERAANE